MKKTLLLSAALVAAMSAQAGYFVVGANVNGAEDWTGTADKELVAQGNGIYVWHGTELGTGFKINGGNGDWNTVNIGGNGADIELGVPYYYVSNGGNIGIFETASVTDVTLTLDENEGTLVLEGTPAGGVDWFLTGVNGNWTVADNDEAYKFALVEGEDALYTVTVDVTAEEGELAVASTGWAKKFGTNSPEEVFVDGEHMNVTLEEVIGEAGNLTYVLVPGTYKFTLNREDEEFPTLTIVKDGNDSAVAGIEAEGAEAVYYNLQGVKVANPVGGVFVKVAGNKASKVLVAE